MPGVVFYSLFHVRNSNIAEAYAIRETETTKGIQYERRNITEHVEFN